jgi:iron(III) transport system substrate-binding protein
MKMNRREFSKSVAALAGLAGAAASSTILAQSSAKPSPTADAPKPTFKPTGVERSKVLKILSGRNRPDLTPVYKMWEQLTGMKVDLTKISHLDAMEKLIHEKNDPQYDLMVTNTMAEPEIARSAGIFEPYRAKVATQYAEWLRAPDYTWLSITAWPRTAMINWATMGRDPSKWPKRFEDLGDPKFKDKVLMSSIQESIVTSYFAAMRVAKGDDYTTKVIDRAFDNGMRLYKSHAQERNALVREGYGIALVNSSNAHVFFLEGNGVGEAWLDQEEGGLGTLVESHTVGVVKKGKNPDAARSFIDFILSKEIQEMLARLYGEAPVNPDANVAGMVRTAGQIRRINATPAQIAARFKDTQKYLTDKGFNMEDLEDPYISQGRGGRRRDKVPAGAAPPKEG